jgi:hypothetical protein
VTAMMKLSLLFTKSISKLIEEEKKAQKLGTAQQRIAVLND